MRTRVHPLVVVMLGLHPVLVVCKPIRGLRLYPKPIRGLRLYPKPIIIRALVFLYERHGRWGGPGGTPFTPLHLDHANAALSLPPPTGEHHGHEGAVRLVLHTSAWALLCMPTHRNFVRPFCCCEGKSVNS